MCRKYRLVGPSAHLLQVKRPPLQRLMPRISHPQNPEKLNDFKYLQRFWLVTGKVPFRHSRGRVMAKCAFCLGEGSSGGPGVAGMSCPRCGGTGEVDGQEAGGKHQTLQELALAATPQHLHGALRDYHDLVRALGAYMDEGEGRYIVASNILLANAVRTATCSCGHCGGTGDEPSDRVQEAGEVVPCQACRGKGY